MSADDVLFVVTLVGALGAALVAGVFFAFSSFVMPGLRRIAPIEGIRAMQAINITAVTPLFMAAFVGTAVLSVLLGAWGVVRVDEPSGRWLLAGGVSYLLASFILTVAYHVPRNNRLAELDAAAAESALYWSIYQREWTAMNHVRALASVLALGAFVAALIEM